MKIAVIGSGISGATCAKFLHQKNVEAVIYEKDEACGGLVHCSVEKNGVIFHQIGGHVFNSKNSQVLDWFWKYFDKEKEFKPALRNAAILLGDRLTSYPIENYIYQLDDKVATLVVNEILELIKKKDQLDSNDLLNSNLTFSNFLLQTFGKTLCDIYFFPYNKKIWQRELDFPVSWLEGKLPMPDPEEIIRSLILRLNENEMVHSSFYYPRKNGSQFIINRLLEEIKVIKNHNVEDISQREGKLYIDGSLYDAVIYTGDIRKLPKIIDSNLLRFEPDEVNYLSYLQCNTTSNVLCECDKNEYSWVYLPSQDYLCHRIIMTGNFSYFNNGSIQNINRSTCTVEFTGVHTKEQMVNEISKLPFNMSYISNNKPRLSYIIQDDLTRKRLKTMRARLQNHNIFLCGRFAEWEYYNMDTAMASAFKVCNDLIDQFNR